MSTAMQTIRLGHSPDSDDAFMFWGLASGTVQSEYHFEHILRDIQTLNEWAMEGKLESTAISVHAFAYVADKYALLRHGGSFGDGYGPMIVAAEPISTKGSPAGVASPKFEGAYSQMRSDHLIGHQSLKEVTIAVPGKLTSAFLELNLWFEDMYGSNSYLKYEVVPFDQIVPAVQRGEYKAGLIIHESQLTYHEEGLYEIANMGHWWKKKTGLPLPLGVNVVRKDLGEGAVKEVSRCMRESIEAGLKERSKALDHALTFARGMDTETSDKFVGMYVNERTRDMGEEGVAAIRLLLKEGARIGMVPAVEVEVVD